ncbi:MAG: serine/threonine-protein kinase [Planctomycetota bacterium]|nr:serine/threonine-protein kinase [Planctomycetota bacterium]
MPDPDQDRYERIQDVFNAAVDISDPVLRDQFIDNECVGDLDLQREVKSLLAAYHPDRSFLEQPALIALREEMIENCEKPILPGYEILREIGRGGMGVVYQAQRKPASDEHYAIKMVRTDAQFDRKLAERFLREGAIGSKLEHKQIVPILDIGTAPDGRLFLCMPFLDGGTLSDRIKRNLLKDQFAVIAELLRGVAIAVGYMHSQGVLHRDMKPSNVLFDAEGKCYIGDFGLAKRMDDSQWLTASGVPLGTLPYMSPDRLRGGRELTPETDVYSLGVILYELLTGRIPIPQFSGEGQWAYRDRLLQERAAPPDVRNPSVPRDLSAICMTCLEQTPAARYASGYELAQDLERFLRHQRPTGAQLRVPRYLKFPVGNIELEVYVLIGGDGRMRYSYPDGIIAKHSRKPFVPPADILAEYGDILCPRRQAARERGAPFVNGPMVRIDRLEQGKTSDERESPFPLKLRTSVTKYFRTQVTNSALDWRLRDGRTIREKYSTDDPSDFASSRLSNPLCVNLSLVTVDNRIYIVRRGQRVGQNPGGWAPAVSGTGNPMFDVEGDRYNPWHTGLREARQEILGEFYSPSVSDITFFGLARVVRNGFPFLFGEVRVTMTGMELESQVPQDRNETLAVVGRPFTIESVVDWVRELYSETDEQGRKTSRAHTTIFSLLQSLKYAYPSNWTDDVVKRL